MKKHSYLLLIFAFALFAACTDLSDVNNRLDDHEVRLTALENQVKNINDNIVNLRALVAAQNDKTAISSYKALEDGSGYVLSMSNGTEIVLKHGTAGSTPVVGVLSHNGELYWSLNGDPILDSEGKPILVNGKEGAPGATPTLRVNADGQWEVSTDGGKTWDLVRDSDGNPTIATGHDGVIPIKITKNGDDTITIEYNGQSFRLPCKKSEFKTKFGLPIEYFATHVLNKTGTGFVKDYDVRNSSVGYFNWYVLNGMQNNLYNLSGTNLLANAALEDWHLPTQTEWNGIIPTPSSDVSFGRTAELYNVLEEVTVNGKTGEYYSNYISRKGKVFGIRLFTQDTKQSSMKSAYKYEYVLDEKSGNYLKITVRHLGITNQDEKTEVSKITSEDWWNSNNEDDLVAVFPSYGRYMDSDSNGKGIGAHPSTLGERGYFWSVTKHEDKPNNAWSLFFSKTAGPAVDDDNMLYAYPVVLVRNAQKME